MKQVFCILFILSTITAHAQSYMDLHRNDTSYLLIKNVWYHKDSIDFLFDPLETYFSKIVLSDDFAFLIKDSIFYDYKIRDIYKIKRGFFITLETRTEDTNIIVKVISFKHPKEKGSNKIKIKIGDTYKMRLVRYNKYPLIKSFEHHYNYDILIGKEAIGIASAGSYSYLFITDNLDGLYYIDSTTSANTYNYSKKARQQIHDFVYNVIRSMTFKEDSSKLNLYMDTHLVHRSLYQHSRLYTNYPKWGIYKYPPKKTESFKWKNFNIDTENFNNHFWGILSYFYNLPKNQEEIDINNIFSENNVLSEILYYEKGIYTVRIVWNIPNHQSGRFFYVGYFAIKESEEGYKVVGFNKFNP
jgi:hypothetical protein